MQQTLFSDDIQKGAMFSPCRQYRYLLWRIWEPDKPLAMFIGVNPSKANEYENDMTVTKDCGFAERWGCGGIYKGNLFGVVATDPNDMRSAADPCGPDNLPTLISKCLQAEIVVACWGGDGAHLNQDILVANALTTAGVSLKCFGITKSGFPRHTSRLAYATQLEPFSARK